MRQFASALLVVVGFAVVPAVALASPVVVGDVIKLQLTDVNGSALSRFGGGGPFRADLPGGNANDFLTFCLEANEHFTPGEDLKVDSISDEAKSGGVSGQDTPTGDRISGTTAFIYTQFRSGNASYANGALIQEVIWYLEGEVTSASQLALNLITLAQQTDMIAANWGPDFLGNVQVMNLRRGTDFRTNAQDMLMIANPEPGSMILLATGLFGVARRLRRKQS